MKDLDKETYIEEETFIVLHSGEIPEVTFHSSLYYLTKDPDGPCLELNGDDILALKQAVVKQYRAIILRDLEPKNRQKRIYRGLARCAANWQRLLKFCSREGIDYSEVRAQTAEALQKFLKQEIVEVESRKRPSCINCSYAEISNLAESLGITAENLPKGLQELCPGEE